MKQTAIQKLAEEFSKKKSIEEMRVFLEGLLTPKEIAELTVRLEIVARLKSGQTQRKIAEDLGVGIATVTRGSREVQKGNL